MRPTQQSDEYLLREGHAADFLNLSSRTLQAWRNRGVGPRFVKAGRAIRYKRADLLTWIDENTIVSAPNAPAQR
jgi:predicted DNA-binding transcriptional regulator AlpA